MAIYSASVVLWETMLGLLDVEPTKCFPKYVRMSFVGILVRTSLAHDASKNPWNFPDASLLV